MLAIEKQIEILAQAGLRPRLHFLNLCAQVGQFAAEIRALGHLAQWAADLDHIAPILTIEESELRIPVGRLGGIEMHRGNHRRPRVDVRGKQVCFTDHRIGQRGLAGFDLPDHGHLHGPLDKCFLQTPGALCGAGRAVFSQPVEAVR